MKYLKVYALVALLMVAAFSIGRFTGPTKVETKIVTKEVESKTRDQNIIEVIKETRSPDGTIVKETRKEKETTSTSQTNKESVSHKSVEARPSFRVGAAYKPAIKSLQEDNYSLIIEKRIVSELYVGVIGSSDRTFGVTVSLGF